MESYEFTKPILTEPGTKYFLSQTLKQCHIIRNKFHNVVFNVGLFVFFFLSAGLSCAIAKLVQHNKIVIAANCFIF